MKKICALLLAVAMVFSMSIVCFAEAQLADGVPVKFNLVADTATEIQPGTDVVVTFSILPEFSGTDAEDNADYHNRFFSYGAFVTFPTGVSAKLNQYGTLDVINPENTDEDATPLIDVYEGVNYAGAGAAKKAGYKFSDLEDNDGKIATVSFVIANAIAGQSYTFGLSKMSAMTVDKYNSGTKEATNGALKCALDLTDTVTITVAGDPEPEVDPYKVEVIDREAVTSTAADTDYQIGTGVGMTVNSGSTVFGKMKWVIATEDGRKYSATISLPNSYGEIKVAATFINGTHDNKFAEAPQEKSYTIVKDDIDAIFGVVDAEGNVTDTYYTNPDADRISE